MLEYKDIRVSERELCGGKDSGKDPVTEQIGELVLPPELPVSFSFRYPCFSGAEAISAFYREITGRFVKWYAQAIAGMCVAKDENATTEDSGAKGRRRARPPKSEKSSEGGFSAWNTYSITRSDDLLSVYFDYCLMDKKQPVAYKRIAQTWLVREERLLSMSETMRFLGADKKSSPAAKIKYRGGDFYVSDSSAVLFENCFAPVTGRVRRSQFAHMFVRTNEIPLRDDE